MLQLTEILPRWGDDADSWVELRSTTTVELDLFAVRICQPPRCALLPRGFALAAGGRVLIHLGVPVTETPGPEEIFLSAAAPLLSEGELGILAPGGTDFRDSGPIQSFVRFGSGRGALTTAAVGAGAWTRDDDSARPPRVSGESLSLTLSGGVGASAWNPTAATPLLDNLDITPSNNVWTSCSFPKNPAPAADVVIAVLDRGTPERIVLESRATDSVSLASFSLDISGAVFPLDAATLAAGEHLEIELDPANDGCAAALCWNDAAAVLPDTGTLALFAATDFLGFVQWGTSTTAPTIADDAVLADRWPLATCSVSVLAAGSSLRIAAVSAGIGQETTSPAEALACRSDGGYSCDTRNVP